MTSERNPQLDALYRATLDDEPTPALDAAILAAAHRNAGARPQSARNFERRWYLPLAAAAVLVISVTVLQLMPREDLLTAPETGVATVAPPPAAPMIAPSPNEAPAAPRIERQSPVLPKTKAKPLPERAAALPPVAQAPASPAARVVVQDAPRELAESEMPRAKEAAPMPSAFPARAIPGAAPAPAAAFAAKPMAKNESEGELRAMPQGEGKGASAAPSVTDTLAAPAASAAKLARQAPMVRRTAGEWIDEMMRLFESHQHDALARELRAFKRQYTDVELPPVLAAEWRRISASTSGESDLSQQSTNGRGKRD